MLEALKEQVFKANLDLVKYELVIFTWGNVSAIDESGKYVVIKPSGIDYSNMQARDMVVVDLEGNIIEGTLKPSSDTFTHLEIYKAFKSVKAVVHTHSKWATIFAQAKRPIPIFGTTHADYFNQAIPVTKMMSETMIKEDYEKNTGKIIVDTFKENTINPVHCPGVIVSEHGPFTWGENPSDAVHNAVVLETIAEMAYHTMMIREDAYEIQEALLTKHYERKHGKNKYYGQ
ncbi:L-ribulose-5-phosphate 4-epimerase [Liberiplasma polymorphum]|uniref:L-ribulose-5-phosphate 4-epimerase n=1 Tax=Liberiplasma polymorphum TaxID=3374570 RepID=UPI0037737F89